MEARLRTFVNFPKTCPITPRQFALWGHSYSGDGDRVTCAFCRRGMFNWEPSDSVYGEHRKHYSACPLARHLLREIDADRTATTASPSLAPAVRALVELGCRQADVSTVYNLFSDRSREDTAAAATLTATTSTPSVDTLARTIFQIQNGPHVAAHVSAKEQDIRFIEDSLRTENSKRRQAKICVVCRRNEVNILFLPCKHIVCCSECYDTAGFVLCCVCHDKFSAYVRVFLS